MDVGVMEGHIKYICEAIKTLCVKLMGGFHYLYIRWDATVFYIFFFKCYSILTVILPRMLAKISKSMIKLHQIAQ